MLRSHVLYVVLIAVFLAGCGETSPFVTNSYNASKNRTVYSSKRMTLAQGVSSGSGYASQTQSSIAMKLRATCTGPNCTPNEARLTFMAEGDTDVSALTMRTISITADDTVLRGGREISRNQIELMRGTTSGEIATVTLPFSDLKKIANASTVSGTLGGQELDLARVQPRLRDFIKQTRN